MNSIKKLVISLVFSLTITFDAVAQTSVDFTGAGPNNNWSESSNWDPNPPGTSNIAEIDGDKFQFLPKQALLNVDVEVNAIRVSNDADLVIQPNRVLSVNGVDELTQSNIINAVGGDANLIIEAGGKFQGITSKSIAMGLLSLKVVSLSS